MSVEVLLQKASEQQIFQDDLCVITCFQNHDEVGKEDPSLLMNEQEEKRSMLRAKSSLEEMTHVS